ncbi:MAG TPA: hypothetical protein VN519_10525 [Bryobacteraceae bacterium]|nr:hypothetical protein [Bryobacteraceae bacterium]
MSEDKLLVLPEANVRPADLPKLRSLHAAAVQKQNADELARELIGASSSHRMLGYDPEKRKQEEREREIRHKRYLEELQNYEQAMRDIRDREDILLARIDAEERRLRKHQKEIEDNAIRLGDGRRVYVDGSTYRDEQGIELHGADHDEAAAQHRDKPNASTWQERTENDRRWYEQERIRHEIEARRAQREHGEDLSAKERKDRIKEEQNAIGRYEQQQDSIEKRAEEIEKQGADQYSVDYGSAYNTTSYATAADGGKKENGLKSEFAVAAPGPGRGDILFPGQPAATGTTVSQRPKSEPV